MATGYATVGIEGLKRTWGWVLALGIAMILLGTIALVAPYVVSLTSVLFFGWLLIVAGALECAHGFWRREWSGFFLDLLAGVLYLVVGFMFIDRPELALPALTLIIAASLMFVGAMRIFVALTGGFQHWVWLLINGIISLALGLLIFKGWPEISYVVIGLFIGVDMLFYGWALVMLAFGVRNLPAARA
ncbi:MAG: HdeD family acid-resistance protein [Pirellulales bacterium]